MTLPEARKLLGLTRAQLARLAGVTDDDLYDLETNRNKRPAWKTVGKVIAALRKAGLSGINPEDIFPLSSGKVT